MASNSAVKKVVTVIPVKPVEVLKGLPENSKRRVCAYCRVSTDNVAQESSFESPVNYYTNYINSRVDWIMVDIFADEGISGTSTEKRTDFKRMIEDCKAGKIDMVITKSISRFARNTMDCLNFVRMLKEKDIAVYFETENINTLDTTGEVLLTIFLKDDNGTAQIHRRKSYGSVKPTFWTVRMLAGPRQSMRIF